MKLAPNWRAILVRAWSLRLMGLALVLTLVEAGLPYIEPLGFVPPGLFGLVSALVIAGAFIARIIAQKGLR